MQICDYISDNNLKNPIYKFHYLMYQEPKKFSKEQFFEKLVDDNDDINIEWLVKNIQAHFYKLVNTILNLLEFHNIQQDKNIHLNIDMEMTIVNLLEYFYIKKSTILDLLDIFYKLSFTVNKNKKQLEEIISKEIKEYLNSEAETFSIFRNLHKDEILNVRNRIIHNEGYSIKGYIVNDEFLFQVYDSNLDEKIYPNPIYSYYSQNELSYKAPLIKVNDYLSFHLCILYKYMDIYLDFLLNKKEIKIDNIDESHKQFIDSSKYIMYTKSNLSPLEKKFKELEIKIKTLQGDI